MPLRPVGSSWVGLGYNQDPIYRGPQAGGAWTKTAFDRMVERVNYMRPGRVRIMLNREWFNPLGTVGEYDWDSNAMKNLYRVLEHYRTEKIPVELGMWGVMPSTDTDPYTHRNTAAVQADLVTELRRRGYTNLIRYNGVNEPNVRQTGVKDYRYADWVTATKKLRNAFEERDLPTNLIGGPDTGEAPISAYDGDLGLEAVPGNAGAAQEQRLTWSTPELTGFTARFYASTPDVHDWEFYGSPDRRAWTKIEVTHTPGPDGGTVADNPRYRTDTSGTQIPRGTQFLRLVMPAHPGVDRAISVLDATVGTGTFTDPMNNLRLTESHTGGWIHPSDKEDPTVNDWWLEAAMEERVRVGGLETHFYTREVDLNAAPDYPEAVLANAVGQIRAARSGVPIILGETGMKAPELPGGVKDYRFVSEYAHGVRMADLAVQEARAGVDGALAWCLDGYQPETQCGMWDHFQADDDKQLRPWFYTWSLLSRYLPAGSTMYAPDDPADVRVLVAKLPQPAGGWTFVLVNRGNRTASVPITAPTGEIIMDKYVYSPSKAPTDPATGFPVSDGQVRGTFDTGRPVSVAADSVVVLTTRLEPEPDRP
ncbi:hypothetical protein QLQ12_44180 [Actinoplanes sp. NEAU-A12]|uniref:Uncharacterized protein n=1 Tax=Actinoplanes sandaracinus TaxID=3045177 RepID=A0ABT6X0R7_9ACTN|nr:hypothetical protein [Actinoplanes sandaracinus]MDI6105601.1 hypothetical protein [Actinoplanes sandaracinus]